jgi:hypothetical protein
MGVLLNRILVCPFASYSPKIKSMLVYVTKSYCGLGRHLALEI